MCGRFVASRPVEEIVEQLGVDEVLVPTELLPGPRFNVSPQDDVLAVRAVLPRSAGDGSRARDRDRDRDRDDAGGGGAPSVQRRLSTYRWGLVPSWANSPSLGARAFNARAETLGEKAMFRTALAKRRCIVPADGFYEWQRLSGAAGRTSGRDVKRQPWCFKAADGHVLGLAGLWEVWRESPESEWLRTCTIITTEANGLMAPIHDRMPVVLHPSGYEAWLAPGALDPSEVHDLLVPVEDEYLVSYRVGLEVGNSRSDGPQLAEPLERRESSEPPLENSSSGSPGPASP